MIAICDDKKNLPVQYDVLWSLPIKKALEYQVQEGKSPQRHQSLDMNVTETSVSVLDYRSIHECEGFHVLAAMCRSFRSSLKGS